MTVDVWTENITIKLCLHERVSYMGFTEKYYYCNKCGVRLND